MSSEEVDRLSNLPEEITSHILSLMPTKFAVRTSILSKRWRFGWTMVTNLDFEDRPRFFGPKLHINRDFDDTPSIQHPNSFSKFVDRVLECCKSSKLESFRLHINDSYIPESSMLNWIDKAVRLNICELDINAFVDKLPLSLLTCKTLTTLRLYHGNRWFSLSESHCQLVNLPCLKTLHTVVFTKPSASAFKLIKGCPILESLSLEVNFYDDEDYIFNIPTLKQLKLRLNNPSRRIVNKVVLRVPNLEYLFVGGSLCSVFVMEDVSSLVEAIVPVRIGICQLKNLVELLKGISRIKSLSAQNINFLYGPAQTSSLLPIFTNLKHLDLRGCCHPRLVLEFLKSSPELKHLYVGGAFSMRFDKRGSSYWIEPKSVPACMLTNLTTIKFSEYNGRKADREFLEYMLGNAEVLKMVAITWAKTFRLDEQTQLALAAQVTNFARASVQCKIHFFWN